MNVRKLSISDSADRLFDSYSTLDVPVVRKASLWGFALVGGTAVQLLARHYGVTERRNRSINDLDFFVSAKNTKIGDFKSFLESEGFEEIKMGVSDYMINVENKELGVEVDVLISWDLCIEDTFVSVGGFLVVSPIEIFRTKVQRLISKSTKHDTDVQDLNTLYDVIVARNEIDKLEAVLSSEGLSEEQIDLINAWIA